MLSGLRDTTRANATGTDSHAFRRRSHHDAHPLQIWIPAPLCQIMGVADAMPVNWALIANLTTCHEWLSPYKRTKSITHCTAGQLAPAWKVFLPLAMVQFRPLSTVRSCL